MSALDPPFHAERDATIVYSDRPAIHRYPSRRLPAAYHRAQSMSTCRTLHQHQERGEANHNAAYPTSEPVARRKRTTTGPTRTADHKQGSGAVSGRPRARTARPLASPPAGGESDRRPHSGRGPRGDTRGGRGPRTRPPPATGAPDPQCARPRAQYRRGVPGHSRRRPRPRPRRSGHRPRGRR